MSDETHEASVEHAPGTHGGGEGPSGIADYAVVVASVVLVAVACYLALKYLFFPGETDETHIKRTILDDQGVDDG